MCNLIFPKTKQTLYPTSKIFDHELWEKVWFDAIWLQLIQHLYMIEIKDHDIFWDAWNLMNESNVRHTLILLSVFEVFQTKLVDYDARKILEILWFERHSDRSRLMFQILINDLERLMRDTWQTYYCM